MSAIDKLNEFEVEIKKDKENRKNEIEKLFEKLKEHSEISEEFGIIISTHIPSIKKNEKKIIGVDEYILKLEREIIKINVDILNLKQLDKKVKKIRKENIFLKLGILIVVFVLIILSYKMLVIK